MAATQLGYLDLILRGKESSAEYGLTFEFEHLDKRKGEKNYTYYMSEYEFNRISSQVVNKRISGYFIKGRTIKTQEFIYLVDY